MLQIDMMYGTSLLLADVVAVPLPLSIKIFRQSIPRVMR